MGNFLSFIDNSFYKKSNLSLWKSTGFLQNFGLWGIITMSRIMAVLSIHGYGNGKKNLQFIDVNSTGVNAMFYTNELCVSRK